MGRTRLLPTGDVTMQDRQDEPSNHREMALVVEHLQQAAYDQQLLDALRQRSDHCSCCGQKLPRGRSDLTETLEIDDGIHVDTVSVSDRRSRL